MEPFVYLIKVNVAILFLYGVFRLFFRDDTFFRWKRVLLSAVLFIALLYPFWDIFKETLTGGNTPEESLIPVIYMDEIIVGRAGVSSPDSFSIGNYLLPLLSIIYFTGALVLIIRTIVRFFALLKNIRKTAPTELNGIKVRIEKGLETPYSFFGWIVLDAERYEEKELREILLHETAHVRQGHSFDTIFSEIMCAFCWFNPFIWKLKKEIRMNLEYLADRAVLQSGYEAEHYQFHLLQLSYSKAIAKISNNFNFSPLKKRIFMMNKKKSSRVSIWKYTLLIPVVALLLFFNSCLNGKKETGTTAEPAPTAKPVKENATPAVEVNNSEPIDSTKVFSHVETPPRFPEGEKALMQYLQENVKYPPAAANAGVQGRVIVQFIVMNTGKVVNAKIVRGVDPDLDAEALRVVKAMPDWTPGEQNGEKAWVYYSLPVLFKLSE